jgi:hypothetical protein
MQEESAMASQSTEGGTGGGWHVPVPPSVPQEPKRRGGVGLGAILIALGVLFLIGQFVPGITWGTMWPAFIILLGVIQIVTPDPRDGWGVLRVQDGIGTLILGSVLLGNTTGFISWDVWRTLLYLWPVVLISIGVSMIGKAVGQTWLRALAPVAIWVAFAYAVAVSLTGAAGVPAAQPMLRPAGQSFSFAEPVADVKEAKLVFDGGAGEIKIRSDLRQLVSADGDSPLGAPEFSVDRTGSSADVNLGLGRKDTAVIWPGFAGGSVDMGLSDSVLWDATLQTGATNLNADFSDVKLKSLVVKTGASSVNIKLGPVPEEVTTSKINVKAGVSSVTIVVPRNVDARIVTHNGLSSTNISNDFMRQGDGSMVTPDFNTASRTYEISIESGVGSVSITRD